MKRFLVLLLTLTMIISVFVVVPTTVNAAEDYRAWAQKDSRWSSIRLGSSPYTIGSDGCLVSSITKLIIQAGFRSADSFNIGTLANWLNSNGGYTSGGLLYWAKPSACVSGFNYYGKLLNDGTYNSSSYNGQLVSWVNSGYHITLQVSNGNHWIAIDEAKTKATGEVYIMDSSYDVRADLTLSSRYGTFNSAVAYTGGSSPNPTPQGRVMSESEGAGRTIPDGDYWINSELSQNYFLDLMGNETVTSNGANVQMWIWENAIPTKYDAFHFEYLNNGYYKISQFGTNQCLDVNEASLNRGSNIQLWESNGTNAQQWSVEKTNHGYKIRSRCCNYYLDICGAKYENGTNIWTWEGYETKSQNFCLIPYSPDERPLADGVYTIWSELDSSLFLDAIGTPEDYKNDTNIDVWYGDEGEQFRIEYAGDGWYRIYENKSGLALEIYNNSDTFMRNGENAKLYQKNDSRGQFWKIKRHTDGSYFLINKMTGYYLDVSHANLENGSDVYQWQYNGGAPNQRWRFIPQGRIMSESEGAGQTIPDGDYWLNSEIAEDYFLDIPGTNYDTNNETNVCMCICSEGINTQYDVFHFEYLNNGYYKITQMNTDMSLDVLGASLVRGTNVQMYNSNNSVAQQWSVEKTSHGYRLRSRSNNFYLDVDSGKYESGTNVRIWQGNDTKAQSFALIPYAPNERPIPDGVYTIWSCLSDNLFLDVMGTSSDFKNDSNINVWNGGVDEKYRVEYVGDGYYRIYEYTSGLAVEVHNSADAFLLNGENAKLYEKNSSKGQLWKIRKNNDGSFFLINKMSGYYLDVKEAKTEDGTNVYQWCYNGGAPNQKWKIRRVLDIAMISVNDDFLSDENGNVYPTISVKADDKLLTLNQDYTIRIDYDIANGAGTITITGINNYCDSVSLEYQKPKHIIGDTNLDSYITISDVTAIQRHLAELDIFGDEQLALADTNGDGEINIADATHLQKYLAEFDGIVLGKA